MGGGGGSDLSSNLNTIKSTFWCRSFGECIEPLITTTINIGNSSITSPKSPQGAPLEGNLSPILIIVKRKRKKREGKRERHSAQFSGEPLSWSSGHEEICLGIFSLDFCNLGQSQEMIKEENSRQTNKQTGNTPWYLSFTFWFPSPDRLAFLTLQSPQVVAFLYSVHTFFFLVVIDGSKRLSWGIHSKLISTRSSVWIEGRGLNALVDY